MAKQSKYIKDLTKAKQAYLEAMTNIEDNPKLAKHTKAEAATMIEETKIHEQIVLESIQM